MATIPTDWTVYDDNRDDNDKYLWKIKQGGLWSQNYNFFHFNLVAMCEKIVNI